MTQKKAKGVYSVIFLVSLAILTIAVVACFSALKAGRGRLTEVADVSLSQIEYASVRVTDKNGSSSVMKISSPDELEKLYSVLSGIKVKKTVSFGSGSESSQSYVLLKLRGQSGLVRLCDSRNSFREHNSGPLSAFFSCYYDVCDPQSFRSAVNQFAA